MLNFHGNGRETAASPFPFRIFFLLFAFFRPFFFGFAFPFLLPLKRARCDECDRISTRAVPLPSPVVSSVRSASFHLLDYHVLFCPRKKHSPRTIFRWKTERSTCFYRRNSRVRSDAHKYSHNLLNRCFALYQCFDRSRIWREISFVRGIESIGFAFDRVASSSANLVQTKEDDTITRVTDLLSIRHLCTCFTLPSTFFLSSRQRFASVAFVRFSSVVYHSDGKTVAQRKRFLNEKRRVVSSSDRVKRRRGKNDVDRARFVARASNSND